ncbi:MAG: rod shape-determining protein MreD [Nitriliruptoraceae bacterium]
MIVRTLTIGLLVVAAAIIQTAVFPLLPTGWFRPDVLLLLVVAAALADGPLVGLRVGFAAGLVSDLLTVLSPVGVGTLVLTAIGFATGAVRPYLAPSSLSAPLLVALVTGVVGTAAHGTLVLLLGDERLPSALLVQAAIGVGIFNVALAPLVLGAVARVLRGLPQASSAPFEQA